MENIVVLGAGLVGKAIILDLYKSYNILVIDIDKNKLSKLDKIPNIETLVTDLAVDTNIRKVIKNADLVIGAVPGFMGFNMLKNVIEAGKNIVDISFFPEDPFKLDILAKDNNVTAVVDCGVCPGMGNIILGRYIGKFDINSYKCLVGGLPQNPVKPWGYKAVFSPIDVIEEYTRPARFKEHGQIVTKPALSDAEFVNLDPVGTLEEWNSDGLRSLLDTMPHIPNLLEKTLRYPGTIEYLNVLRELGYFSDVEIDVKGNKVRPIDLTAELLFPKWKLEKGEKEFTIMQVIIEGKQNNKQIKYVYDLYDEYNKASDTFSMARTTGYTCTAAAELVLKGSFNEKGVNPPEYLGKSENNFRFMLQYLAERGVIYRKRTEDQ
ncbi:MAG: saccharopine dehydrogenase NADP-binding domain-containing protein [Bacteroidales bacterium]|nr:saccharopine dehydrogenase NADP-binding domain-containing protein [Bacteroidales bacterium]